MFVCLLQQCGGNACVVQAQKHRSRRHAADGVSKSNLVPCVMLREDIRMKQQQQQPEEMLLIYLIVTHTHSSTFKLLPSNHTHARAHGSL